MTLSCNNAKYLLWTPNAFTDSESLACGLSESVKSWAIQHYSWDFRVKEFQKGWKNSFYFIVKLFVCKEAIHDQIQGGREQFNATGTEVESIRRQATNAFCRTQVFIECRFTFGETVDQMHQSMLECELYS